MSMFQSKAWQDAWWGVWGGTNGFALLQTESAHEHSAVSALYVDSYKYRNVLPVRCLQFVGTNYRRVSTPRSEYNCLSSSGIDSAEERLKNLIAVDWTEAVFRDLRSDSEETDLIKSWARTNGWWAREVHNDRAYSIRTSGQISDYLAGLGASTRLKLINRRKVLESTGKVSLKNCWRGSPESFFTLLNRFHVKRWGSPCFNADSLKFHLDFLRLVEAEGGEPDLSLMKVDGTPISVVYNVEFGGCLYNLQSGFNECFHKKLALGTLHLGYCLERAFADPRVHVFDLLAGTGKNSDYKAHLADTHCKLTSLMVVRSQMHQTLYRCKEELSQVKRRLKRQVS